jgi:hypothetical protein
VTRTATDRLELSSSGDRVAGPSAARPPIRFDRNELSGSFGDLGTDLPLLVGMVVASGLDATSVLVVFGALQILTGVVYRMPMPVQPLKAVAAIVITQQVAPGVLHGGGLAIGVLMLALSVTGGLEWLARVVPRVVVRGLQLGLALQLGMLAVGTYIPSAGASGLALAGVSLAIIFVLLGNRRVPPAPIVVAVGVAWALAFSVDVRAVAAGAGIALPIPRVPSAADVWTGLFLLAIPQVPLSLGNSILATRQVAHDLLPERPPLRVRSLGLTYAAMNLASPFLGGVPTCHGSGGMTGHFALGGRTGGSVVIYGVMLLTMGLFFGGSFAAIAQVFPRPMLGVLLLVEAAALGMLSRDLVGRNREMILAGALAATAALLPYGYVIALVLGVAVHALMSRSTPQ